MWTGEQAELDIREPILSITAALKLLRRGHYGALEPAVAGKLDEIHEKINALLGVSEEYLSRIRPFANDVALERAEMS